MSDLLPTVFAFSLLGLLSVMCSSLIAIIIYETIIHIKGGNRK